MTTDATKKTLLFISFSESETSFLTRVAKSLMSSEEWDCSLLALHLVKANTPLANDLKTDNIAFKNLHENGFYDRYESAHSKDLSTSITAPSLGSISGLRNKYRELKKEPLPITHPQFWNLLLLRVISFFYRLWLHSLWQIKYLIPNVMRIAKNTLAAVSPRAYRWARLMFNGLKFIFIHLPLINKLYNYFKQKEEIARLRKAILSATHFIHEAGASVLILAKDSSYYPTTAFVRAAKDSCIPSVVIPYDRADSETLAKDRAGHPDHVVSSFNSKLVAKQYPQWVYRRNNEALLLARANTVRAVEFLKLAPPNPWLYNGSLCDKILVETQEDQQLFISGGANESQLAIIGAPYMDRIDELKRSRVARREDLCRQYGYDISKPFVVASVPPNKLAQRNIEIEFKTYNELITKWSTALSTYLDCNLIYSLHPLTDYSEVAHLETKGAVIVPQPLEELLALADLYVVDCSGTTRWARYAGVEAIDYDLYNYNLWFNSKLEGVRHIHLYEDFVVELTSANARLRIQRQSSADSHGSDKTQSVKFSDRLNSALTQLISNKKVIDVI